MNPEALQDAFILTGPTASGKSAVGLHLAERLNAEIISMDSMAVYQEMDIGTAKPHRAQQRQVPHHLIDCLKPSESATLAWWLRAAVAAGQTIRNRGKRILVVGGTPLYLKGLLRGIFEGPGADRSIRLRYASWPEQRLRQQLASIDPVSENKIKANDTRRLIRALEVFELTGRPISSWQTQFDTIRPRPYPPVWLNLDRSLLHQRIHKRVDQMVEQGFVQEVQKILLQFHPLSNEVQGAAGYAEMLAHLAGAISLEEAIERTKTRTRQLAKRQVTWFRHLQELTRLDIAEHEPTSMIADRILQLWNIP